MSVFVNRNLDGKWKKVEVSDAEIATIEKNNFKANMRIAANVAQYLPSLLKKQVPEGVTLDPEVVKSLIPVFVEKMTTPLHFSIENYVDEKLTKELAKSL